MGDTKAVNKIYPKMERSNRAKQFIPFDALKGFREALAEKERIIISQKELSEEKKSELNNTLKQLKEMDMLTVKYYANGEYIQLTGIVTMIDRRNCILKVVTVEIPFENIYDLQIT